MVMNTLPSLKTYYFLRNICVILVMSLVPERLYVLLERKYGGSTPCIGGSCPGRNILTNSLPSITSHIGFATITIN